MTILNQHTLPGRNTQEKAGGGGSPARSGDSALAKRQRGSSIQRVVLKDGAARWRFRLDLAPDVLTGKRRQRTLTFATEREAVEAQAKARVGVHSDTYVEPSRATLNAVLDEYLSAKEVRWKQSTAYTNKHALVPFREILGATRVQRLTEHDVERAVRTMLREGGIAGTGRAPRTVRTALLHLSAALRLAQRRGYVPKNVAEHVELPASRERTKTTWVEEEVRTFLDAVDADPLVGVWHLLAAGMRRGEVLGVTWGDVDEAAGVVRVRQTRSSVGGKIITGTPKTVRSVRDVPLTPGMRRALRLTAERTLSGGAVVQLRQTAQDSYRFVAVDEAGRPMIPHTFARRFHAIAASAGLPRIRVHDMRGTAASIMLRNGVPVHIVAAVIGDDPAVLMRHYSHANSTDVRGAMDILSRAIGNR